MEHFLVPKKTQSLQLAELERPKGDYGRHFRALTRKNCINWRRTPIGSLLEILLPVLLCLSLAWVRTLIVPEQLDSYDLYNLKKPLYPMASLENDTWTHDLFSTQTTTATFQSFMDYNRHYGKDGARSNYTALYDTMSPLFFFPPHCYANEQLPFTSPLIGYVAQKNGVQRDVVQQLALLFENQRKLLAILQVFETPRDDEAYQVAKIVGFDTLARRSLVESGYSDKTAQKLSEVIFSTDGQISNFTALYQTGIFSELSFTLDQTQMIESVFQITGHQLNSTYLQTTGALNPFGLTSDQEIMVYLLTDLQETLFEIQSLNKTYLLDHFNATESYITTMEHLAEMIDGRFSFQNLKMEGFFTEMGLSETQVLELEELLTLQTSNFTLEMLRSSIIFDQAFEDQDLSPTQFWELYDRGVTHASVNDTGILVSLGLNQTEQDVTLALIGLREGSVSLADLSNSTLVTELGLTAEQRVYLRTLSDYVNGNLTSKELADSGLLTSLNLTDIQSQAFYLFLDLNEAPALEQNVYFANLTDVQAQELERLLEQQGNSTFNFTEVRPSLAEFGFTQEELDELALVFQPQRRRLQEVNLEHRGRLLNHSRLDSHPNETDFKGQLDSLGLDNTTANTINVIAQLSSGAANLTELSESGALDGIGLDTTQVQLIDAALSSVEFDASGIPSLNLTTLDSTLQEAGFNATQFEQLSQGLVNVTELDQTLSLFGFDQNSTQIIADVITIAQTGDIASLQNTTLSEQLNIDTDLITALIQIQAGNFTLADNTNETLSEVLTIIQVAADESGFALDIRNSTELATTLGLNNETELLTVLAELSNGDLTTLRTSGALTNLGFSLDQITAVDTLLSSVKITNADLLTGLGVSAYDARMMSLLLVLEEGNFTTGELNSTGVFLDLGIDGRVSGQMDDLFYLMDNGCQFQQLIERGLLSVSGPTGEILISIENGEQGPLTFKVVNETGMLAQLSGQDRYFLETIMSLDKGEPLVLSEVESYLLAETNITNAQIDLINQTLTLRNQTVNSGNLAKTFNLTRVEESSLQQFLDLQQGDLNFTTLNETGTLGDLTEDQNKTLDQLQAFQIRNPIFIKNLFLNLTTQAEVNRTLFDEFYLESDSNILESIREMTHHLDWFLAKDWVHNFGQFSLREFESQTAMDDYIKSFGYGYSQEALCFAFTVHDDNELEIFLNDLPPEALQSLPNQKQSPADPAQQLPLILPFALYTNNGFSFLQNLVANTLLRRETTESASIATMVTPMKVPRTAVDNFTLVLLQTLPFMVLLFYIPLLYRLVYRIVSEKGSRAKEIMRMVGMSSGAYWCSWLWWHTCVNTLIGVLATCVLKVLVIPNCSVWILFAVIWGFGQSLFGLALVAQSLFVQPRSASVSTTIVYFGTALFQFVIDSGDSPRSLKLLLGGVFPTVAIQEGLKAFVKFQSSGPGLTFDTWHMEYLNYSVRDCILCLFVGGFIGLALGVYLELVMPKTYGARKSVLFCCQRSRKNTVNLARDSAFETKYLDREMYEPVADSLTAQERANKILIIQDLFKEYSNKTKAVDGVNLKLYSDQIFCLLGENGAGKTTTLSMLTGLMGPSSGHCSVFGVDLFKQMGKARQFMGVCPQHDAMFELLTVEEHLDIFYELKGANQSLKKQEISQLIQDSGLSDKAGAQAHKLSGGNRRKLSVCLALCGGSRFVLLDEPTSGMDLQARRQLWNMLREYKKDRIILLTTHYMDEADILGDRIAILSKGKVACLGTSPFLKKKFGAGYKLFLQKEVGSSGSKILEYFQNQLGQHVKMLSNLNTEMVLKIPNEYSDKFANCFQSFEPRMMGVTSYGLTQCSLEEVFKNMAQGNGPPEPTPEEIHALNNSQMTLMDADPEKQAADQMEKDISFKNSFLAVLTKRLMIYKGNKKAVFNEVFLPALIMLIGVLLIRLTFTSRSASRLQLPSRLPLPQPVMFNGEPVLDSDIPVAHLASNLTNAHDFAISYSDPNQFSSLYDFANIVYNERADAPPYSYGAYQIFEANRSSQQYSFVSWVNTTSQDAAGLYPQFMYESILRVATGNPDFSFKVRSTPYPRAEVIGYGLAAADAGTIIFIGAISYSVLATTVVSYLVTERVSGLKHLQSISGMHLRAYWLGNFVIDCLKLQVTITVTLVLFVTLNLDYQAAWLAYLLIPLALLPFTYVTSFLFTVDSAAQTFTMFLHFCTIAVFSTAVSVFRMTPDLEQMGDDLNWIFRLLPSYSLGASVYFDAMGESLSALRAKSNGNGGPISEDLWHVSNIGGDILMTFVHFLLWTSILVLIESGVWRKAIIKKTAQQITDDDGDVADEAVRIAKSASQAIRVVKYRKVYSSLGSKKVTAVNQLSFGVSVGECFALLGVNGAGKTTTFQSLTGRIRPTQGSIQVSGLDVTKNFDQVRNQMGYCPQSNLLFESMTVLDHITYYAALKGIPRAERKRIVTEAIAKLALSPYTGKEVGTLSGGNKRKVLVAQALIGNPQILLLDEPSSGMDPESRRFLWNVLAQISQKKQCAIVFTTHTMDEAEALSSKMGIMAKGGNFRCFGSAEHIRNKFSTGYIVELKIKPLDVVALGQLHDRYLPDGVLTIDEPWLSEELLDMLQEYACLPEMEMLKLLHLHICQLSCLYEFSKTFETCEILEKLDSWLKVRIPRGHSIGRVFEVAEKVKVFYDVLEYSVTETTLETVFQEVARAEGPRAEEGAAFVVRERRLMSYF